MSAILTVPANEIPNHTFVVHFQDRDDSANYNEIREVAHPVKASTDFTGDYDKATAFIESLTDEWTLDNVFDALRVAGWTIAEVTLVTVKY